jgi:hypothetical protein
MQRGNRPVSIYFLVGTTAICALDFARYFPETGDTFIPTKNYSLKRPDYIKPWNNSYGIDIPSVSETDAQANMSIITQFAEKLVAETVDLDHNIVNALGQKFWDLI